MLTSLLRSYARPYLAQVTVVVVLLIVQTVGNLYLPNLNADIINGGVVKGDISAAVNGGMVWKSRCSVSRAVLQSPWCWRRRAVPDCVPGRGSWCLRRSPP